MDDYELFKQKILKKTDLDLSLYKEKQMKRRIYSLASRNGYDNLAEYFKLIDSDDEKFEEFLNFLTINVSEFFRNVEQWDIVEKSILPSLLQKNSSIKIWSAACSTGEEPYTLLMILKRLNAPIDKIQIIASDIDDGALEKAKIGIYPLNSLKNVSPDLKTKYFKKTDDGKYAISDEIKQKIKFMKHNLLKDPFVDGCNLIVCRNVMIYFTDEAKSNIYTNFSKSLNKDGVLFVGSTEQIINPGEYNLKSLKTFFYGRVDGNYTAESI